VLAQQAKLPIIIHCRDAWSDCLNMIEDTGDQQVLAEFCIALPARSKMRGAGSKWVSWFPLREFQLIRKHRNIRNVAKELRLRRS